MSLFGIIRGLHVCHWPKGQGSAASPVTSVARHELERRGLFVDTCLRQLHVSLSDYDLPSPAAGEIYRREQAYRFLLEVTTGLRSAVPGETNVLGQFRDTWRKWHATDAAGVMAPLSSIVSQLMRDARMIRRDHLQGIGGLSYGSLVRRLIRPASGDRVLFVGGGKLARSMLPLFSDYRTAIWNRRKETGQNSGADHYFLPRDGGAAARWADHVVLTTPPEPANDRRWLRWLLSTDLGTVVHLGHRSGDGGAWCGPYRFFVLDDVFTLREAQSALRCRRIEQAFGACRMIAARRSRGPRSVTLPVPAGA